MANKALNRGGKKLKARKARRAQAGKHYKIPGFDAFSPHVILTTAPAAVVSQSGFLSLPFEVQLRIYEYAIEDFSCGTSAIEPRKKGNKFTSFYWSDMAKEERIGKHINNITESTKLSLLSRKTYIDFTGGSLLYRLKAFRFASPTLLLNYLCVINPVHKSSIREFALHIYLKPHSTTLPTKAFQLLSTCTNIQNVTLIIRLPRDMCRFSDVFVKPGTSAALLAAWEGYSLSSNQGVYSATVGLGVDAIAVWTLLFLV
ncbi:uncharacterized protein RAG0_07095 [Rhynchosporium agropyri]|uniref:Uncharacterized protein n=1 Tax=Rhynchosporium agropyri TaxID=914238 RepID=A0A1E1KJV6_9HELO|nr:uncharacterized protein RAG0_07095 [Rhynchosporium agropyri]